MNVQVKRQQRNIRYTEELFSLESRIKTMLDGCKGDKKTYVQVIQDLLLWLWKYNAFDCAIYRHWESVEDVVKFYFKLHLYRKNTDVNDYVVQGEWSRALYVIQKHEREAIRIINQKDKFYDFFSQHGVRLPKRLGQLVCKESQLYVSNNEKELVAFSLYIKEYHKLFCKPVDDCCGKSTYKVEYSSEEGKIIVNGKSESLVDFSTLIFDKKLIVETLITNHPDIAKLNESSLNTLRLITMKDETGAVKLFYSGLRVGRSGMWVDNFSAGGVTISATEEGQLCEEDSNGDEAHPDSGILYTDVVIPYFSDAVNLVVNAHAAWFSSLIGIGWDVAITEDGPVLIEGGTWFGCGLIQSSGKPLRKYFIQNVLPQAQASDIHFPAPSYGNQLERNILYTIDLFDAKGEIEKRLMKSIEKDPKSLSQVMHDLLVWLWKYNAFDYAIYRFWGTIDKIVDNYFDSLCERSECKIDDYLCEAEMHKILYELQIKQKTLIKKLNNKKSFSLWCKECSLPTTAQIGVIKGVSKVSNGEPLVFMTDGNEMPLHKVVKEYGGIFCKPKLDTWGRGALRIEFKEKEGKYLMNNSLVSELPEIASDLVVEKIVRNHKVLEALHPASLNTLRINTIKKSNGSLDILWGCLRMGTKGRPVDNLFGGGVIVKVNVENGELNSFDTYKNSAHPDTHVAYKSVTIPYWDEVLKLALMAHKAAGDFLSIGWDIAVTPDGPVLIEANVWFGIGPQQSFIGGMRPIFEDVKKSWSNM